MLNHYSFHLILRIRCSTGKEDSKYSFFIESTFMEKYCCQDKNLSGKDRNFINVLKSSLTTYTVSVYSYTSTWS